MLTKAFRTAVKGSSWQVVQGYSRAIMCSALVFDRRFPQPEIR